MEQLITSCRGQVVDLRLLGPDEPTRQTDACVRAMASGAEVIIGGLLPVDGPGHRVGRPDLLVRGADRLDGTPGYHPVEVKWHKICEPPRPPIEVGDEPPAIRYSSLGQPAPASAAVLPGQSLRVVSRWADLVQLAHYHRMLEACGHAAGPAAGAVIGTDGLFDEPVLVWADLNEPLLRTFSRSRPEGWRLRSALERYDFEHAFRLEIAAVARQQTGHPERDPAPLVTPIVNPGVRPLPLVGALPAPAASGRRQPADRQGSPRLARDRHAAAPRDHDDHRSGRCRPRPVAGVVPAGGDSPQRGGGTVADRGAAGSDATGGDLVRARDHRPDRGARGRHRDRLRHRERRRRADLPLGIPGRRHLFRVQPIRRSRRRVGDRARRRGAPLAAECHRHWRPGRGLPLQRVRGGPDPRAGRPRARSAARLGRRVRRGALRRPAGDSQRPTTSGWPASG